jgi:putative flippase GtrA
MLTHFLHLHYLLSATISFTAGVVGLGFNDLFMWIFTDRCGIYYLLSKVITTAIVYFWNFFARKYILFK